LPTPSSRQRCPIPDPFPRIRRPSPSAAACPSSGSLCPPCRYRPALASWVRRLGSPRMFLPRFEAPRAATLTRIVSAALFNADEFRVARGVLYRPLHTPDFSPHARVTRPSCGRPQRARIRRRSNLRLERHPCRWPPTPAVPAINCCARLICQGAGLNCQEPSPISVVHFRSRRRGEIYARVRKSRRNSCKSDSGYPPFVATSCGRRAWSVQNAVEKVTGKNLFAQRSAAPPAKPRIRRVRRAAGVADSRRGRV
jgi:hypothetical protein